ncbi:MAG: hypothetical protein FRX48_08135 [Lasallia pustulata]|uniref:Uncharacterized protein n=1 Tax=Lasallia pustulata TaxID=136370 RepID=A0A5M8PH70_9LECA|nr:MAG: hypothetical protein FRX48_08135 [Lasallia pustulata]
MPSFLHEKFIVQIVGELQCQLKSIEGASAEFAKEIISSASASIKFADQEYSKHDPDVQFTHSKARYPGVVIEVSYSQKGKDLGRLSNDYIPGSDSEIRVVVGLDIEYKMTKKATLSVWQPSIVTNEAGEKELVTQQIVANQVFRDSNEHILHRRPTVTSARLHHNSLGQARRKALRFNCYLCENPMLVSSARRRSSVHC